MNATVHDLDGEEAGSVELPAVFETAFRPDLIGRAVEAAQANRKQAYGADEFAGLRTPAESFGSGRGLAHVPRSDQTSSVGQSPPHRLTGNRPTVPTSSLGCEPPRSRSAPGAGSHTSPAPRTLPAASRAPSRAAPRTRRRPRKTRRRASTTRSDSSPSGRPSRPPPTPSKSPSADTRSTRTSTSRSS